MGQEIASSGFSESDFQRFRDRLREETDTLGEWLRTGAFPELPLSIGYELEACLVNRDLQPADANAEFLRQLAMPEVVPELARCNIEFNGHPQTAVPDGLDAIRSEMESWLTQARRIADGLDLRIAMIGILPTLSEGSLGLDHISDSNRYRAIDRSLARLRGRPHVEIHIDGNQRYRGRFDSIMAESAATSFQMHVRLPVADAHHWYNAALACAAPLLAIGANSPYLFGHDLWAETRLPVFAQSVDTGRAHWVTFGSGYVQQSLLELFEINASRYPPLLPERLEGDGLPHLILHNSTVWRWLRPILDTNDPECPHLRLEFRCLPSGPSVPDMIAAVALLLGLLKAFGSDHSLTQKLSFDAARGNFYQAARYGMDATLLWLDGQEYSAQALWMQSLLSTARDGLHELGYGEAVIDRHLQPAEERIHRGFSGAGWQRAWVRRNGLHLPDMLAAYLENQESGLPVAQWPL